MKLTLENISNYKIMLFKSLYLKIQNQLLPEQLQKLVINKLNIKLEQINSFIFIQDSFKK